MVTEDSEKALTHLQGSRLKIPQVLSGFRLQNCGKHSVLSGLESLSYLNTGSIFIPLTYKVLEDLFLLYI